MILVTRSPLNVCLVSRFGLFSVCLGSFNAILLDCNGLRSFAFYYSRNIAIIRCFLCNSRRNHANQQSKNIRRLVTTLGRSRMKIQEVSEDLTEGEIMFPGPKTSYMEANTQRTENQSIRAWNALTSHAPVHCVVRAKTVFSSSFFFEKKPDFCV